jgi:hypothetical protein
MRRAAAAFQFPELITLIRLNESHATLLGWLSGGLVVIRSAALVFDLLGMAFAFSLHPRAGAWFRHAVAAHWPELDEAHGYMLLQLESTLEIL